MERIQGRFVEMAVNQNTVLTVNLGMLATSGIGLEITSRGRAISNTSNKPLHNEPPEESSSVVTAIKSELNKFTILILQD